MNILVIDEDQEYAKSLSVALTSNFDEMKVVHVPRFEDAVEQYRELTKTVATDGEPSPAIPSIDVAVICWDDLREQQRSKLDEFTRQATALNTDRGPLKLVSAFDRVNMAEALAANVADVFYKPFDDLLFLQKFFLLRFLMQGRLFKIKPGNFLYTAKNSFVVELGTHYGVQAISENGVEVLNRAPLAKGRRLKMYSNLFGASGRRGIYGNAHKVHEIRGEFKKTEIIFFGLFPDQVKHFSDLKPSKQAEDGGVRAAVTPSVAAPLNAPTNAPATPGEGATTTPSLAFFANEKKSPAQVLLVDLDREAESTIAQLFEKHSAEYELCVFHSLDRLLRALESSYGEGKAKRDAELKLLENVKWAETPLFSVGGMPTVFLNQANFSFVRFSDPIAKGATMAGYDLGLLFAQTDVWEAIIHPPDLAQFMELLQYAASGQEVAAEVRMKAANGSLHFVRVVAKLRKFTKEALIAMEVFDRTSDAKKKRSDVADLDRNYADYKSAAAVVIDLNFMRTNPTGALIRLQRTLALATGRESLPIFLLSKEIEHDVNLNIDHPSVVDLFYKPIERGYFMRKFSHVVLEQPSRNRVDSPGSLVQSEVWLDVVRQVSAEGVGEYGLEVVHRAAVPEGAWGHFYHPDFLDGEGRGLLARCIHSEPTPEGLNKMSFLFLGLREDTLTKLRLFIKKFSVADPEAAPYLR